MIIGTSKVNRLGVPLSVFFGGVKMMIPNMVKYPILMLPILTTAIVSGLVSALVGIHGTKESAGFGFIGMVGPINAFKFMEVDSAWLSVLLIVVAFFVVPFVTAWLADIIYRKVFR
ncbi:PTS sugar transporter subunit IIC, partial [Pseudomonas aeruginosa]|nr:PTS sugar transporter subunit IIC [Pseudomonas aeruginosa]